MSSSSTALSSASSSTASHSASASPQSSAPAQAGILEHGNPTVYSATSPLILFIIQAGLIIIFCRLLHYPLSKLRQPRVIAEVIGGILLGPSVMMRIPGFQAAIFPKESMANLNLVANLGLVLFLFLVGLEVNMRMFVSNWRVALSVGLAGMVLPFGLGSAIAWGLYNEFRGEPDTVTISFGVYMLFIGTAISITAFPVLCRILTELKLLHTPVGITVLAAGVGNDVTGWILLALCVALVNNGSGVVAVYVLLTAVGWILFLVFLVRPAFMWLLRRSGSLEKGPSQAIMALTLLLTLTSAWFTGVIGIHPIFGAFLMGLICPHDGGFARKVTEKIEDLVAVLFLPLYFALSGLSTNLGLLDDGITWGYVFGVIVVAFLAKVIGGTLAARLNKLVWRESFTIGVLMSCKGLVELIVLNIGLSAKILSTRTFTIFVVMALVTTVATTPLTLALYPPVYRRKLEAWKRGEIDWSGNLLEQDSEVSSVEGPVSVEKNNSVAVKRLLVYLRLDCLPSLFTFITLLGGDSIAQPAKSHHTKEPLTPSTEADQLKTITKRPLQVHGLRMLELTERTSTVMQVAEVESDTYRDPVINTFRTFAQLHSIACSGTISVVPESDYAETLTHQASDHSSDLVLIPWSDSRSKIPDILDSPAPDAMASDSQEAFVHAALQNAACNTAIFIDRGFGGRLPSRPMQPQLTRAHSGLSVNSWKEKASLPILDRSHHVFFPFFGGRSDRSALRFVMQLAKSSNVTATIVHFRLPSTTRSSPKMPEDVRVRESESAHSTAQVDAPKSKATSPPLGHIEQLSSSPTDHKEREEETTLLHSYRDSMGESLTRRIVFTEVATLCPTRDAVEKCREEIGQSPRNAGDLVVLGRNITDVALGEGDEVWEVKDVEMKKLFGVVAEAILSCGVRTSVVVVQAGAQG